VITVGEQCLNRALAGWRWEKSASSPQMIALGKRIGFILLPPGKKRSS
jgi:hypothetical protein